MGIGYYGIFFLAFVFLLVSVVINAVLLVGAFYLRRAGSTWPALLMIQGAAIEVLAGLGQFVFTLLGQSGGFGGGLDRTWALLTMQGSSILQVFGAAAFAAGFFLHARAAMRNRPDRRV